MSSTATSSTCAATLSTMFNVSDVMIDKEEVSMTFKVPVHIQEESSLPETEAVKDGQITILDGEGCVSGQSISVSKTHMKKVVQKVAQILAAQGVPCCECSKTLYKLYPLSDCKETNLRYSLEIVCPDGKMPYRFELKLSPIPSPVDTPAHMQDPCGHKVTENEKRR